MINNKTILSVLFGVTLGAGAMASQAAVLTAGDLLTITPGVYAGYDSYGNPYGASQRFLVRCRYQRQRRARRERKICHEPRQRRWSARRYGPSAG